MRGNVYESVRSAGLIISPVSSSIPCRDKPVRSDKSDNAGAHSAQTESPNTLYLIVLTQFHERKSLQFLLKLP